MYNYNKESRNHNSKKIIQLFTSISYLLIREVVKKCEITREITRASKELTKRANHFIEDSF